MRWFKHMTNASNDLFIQDIEAEFGDTGYVFWFKTLELLGSQGEHGSMDISETVWRQVIHSHRTDHLRRLYAFATDRGKLTVEKLSNGLLRVKCRKFAEFADNYTKYDGVSSKRLQRHFKVSSKQEEDIEEEVEEEKTIGFSAKDAFASVWNLYPRRIGRKLAEKHFAASVKSQADVDRVNKALANYKAKLAAEKTEEKFIQHGSTWFNNWQDWENAETVKPQAASPLKMFGGPR